MPAKQCSFQDHRREMNLFSKATFVSTAFAFAVAASVITAAGSRADERHLEFVQKLQEQGFADVAVEYMRSLRERGDAPAEIIAELDFEIGKSLILQSEEADAETERKLLDEAAAILSRYLQDQPESAAANDALAEVHLKQGQQLLARAESEKDATAKKNRRLDARKALEEALKHFSVAAAKYREELGTNNSDDAKTEDEPKSKADLKGKTKPAPKRKPRTKPITAAKSEADARVEAALIRTRLHIAISEFSLGRTFDPADTQESKTRVQRLDAANQTFDGLFQEYRGAFAGFVAHLWHGRSLEERGDLRQALMIYDEVIVNEPARGAQVPREQVALFVQAELFRLRVLNKQAKHAEVIAEAQQWINANQDKRRTPHALGIQLELAKAHIGNASNMPAGSNERRAAFARALQILNNEVTRFRSPYQDEAFRIRVQHADEVTLASGKIASFDEGQFIGDSALAKDPPQFEDAIVAYEQALTHATDKTDADERDATAYRLAFAYYRTGNWARASTISEELVQSRPQSKWAPECAALALIASSSAYAAAESDTEKQKELDNIVRLANLLEDRWPEHSQADIARRTMGGILLFRREFLNAAETYARIREGSPYHADAQFRAGQCYWNAYLTELAKQEAERDEALMDRLLDQARSALTASLALQADIASDKNAPTSLHVETQLLAGELELKTGNPQKASSLLEPLVPLVQTSDREDLAGFSIRILVGAMEAAIARGELAKAEAIMGHLEQQGGGDTTRITQVLVGLGRGLEQQLRQHEASGRTAEAQTVRESYELFLGKLSSREQQSFGSLQYLAESYFAMNQFEKAGELYQRMIQVAKADPAFERTAGARSELVRVRLRLASTLRLTKQFAPALEVLDALLQENDRLLAAVMEKGRVLQDWAEQVSAKFADAARHWDQTSRRLQNMSPRPAEYFEARFGVALCLSKTGRKDDAVRVLRSTMTLSPAVGGPESRAQYESLLKQLDPAGPAPP